MSRATLSPRVARAAPVLAVFALTLPLAGFEPARVPGSAADDPPKDQPDKSAKAGDGLVEVRFTDGSTLKVKLRDEKLELQTPYGKLLIPAADVRQIDFATRVPD